MKKIHGGYFRVEISTRKATVTEPGVKVSPKTTKRFSGGTRTRKTKKPAM